MTNREKFEEVFGFPPREDAECVAPIEVCYLNNDVCASQGRECPFYNWWDKEYKECFKLRPEVLTGNINYNKAEVKNV